MSASSVKRATPSPCPTPPCSPEMRILNGSFGPTRCLNTPYGCNKVFDCSDDLEKHLARCPRRYVTCESCNRTVVQHQLLKHQQISQCLERKLKQDIVRGSRKIKDETINHVLSLKLERVRLDRYDKRRYRDMVHSRTGWTPRVPSALSHRSGTIPSASITRDSVMSTCMNLDGDLAERPSATPTDVAEMDGGEVSPSECLSRQEPVSYSRYTGRDTYLGPCPTVLPQAPLQCTRCNKYFWTNRNHGRSCRWHKGVCIKPISVID